MRNFITNKVKNVFTGMAGFLIAIPLLIAGGVYAATVYPAGSLLQPSDVTSSHIRNNEIVNADINASAAIVPTKLWGEGTGGQLFYTNYSRFGTSTALSWATSTSKLTITGALSVSASTTFNGAEYLFPSADGTNGTALKTNGAGNLSWGTVSASQTLNTFTAGNTITAGQALFLASSTASTVLLFSPAITTDTDTQMGDATARTKWAQEFTETNGYLIEKITLTLKKTGAPADNFQVAVQADNAGAPSGTDLAIATKAGGTITTSAVSYALSLNVTASTTANTKYWLVFSRNGAVDGSNYYWIASDNTSSTYASGKMWNWNGSVWTDQGPADFGFEFNASSTAGRVYATDADEANTTQTFIGFANEGAVAGETFDVIVDGVMTGLSGLTLGIPYYVSNTLGAISSTAGTVSKKVGGALSATTLLIQNTW